MAVSTAREVGTVQNRLLREEGDTLGRGFSQLGKPLGEAVDQHMVSQAISHGAAAASALWANKTQEWNQLAANSDPNDHSIADKWREQGLEPDLQKFQQSFENAPPRAQEWAQRQVDNMRQHFFEKTSADMGTRAGEAAVANLKDMERNYSTAAANDTSTLDFARDALARDFKDAIRSSPYMTADAASRLENEELPKMLHSISMTAAVGLGTRQPDQLISEIAKGKWDGYLTKEEQNRAVEGANRFKEAQYTMREHDRTLKLQEARDTAEKAKDEYISDIMQGKTPDMTKVATDPRFASLEGGAQKEQIVAFASRRTTEIRENAENAQHPATFHALSTTMIENSQNGVDFNPKLVQDAYAKGQISFKELTRLTEYGNSMDKPFTRQFNGELGRAQRALNANSFLSAFPDKAAYAVNRLQEDALETLNQYRAKGQDVRPLLDQNSPQYLFTPARLASYAKQAVTQAADDTRATAAKTGNAATTDNRDPSRVTRGTVNGGPAAPSVKAFASEAEAKAAGLKDGERVTIGGKTGVWKN